MQKIKEIQKVPKILNMKSINHMKSHFELTVFLLFTDLGSILRLFGCFSSNPNQSTKSWEAEIPWRQYLHVSSHVSSSSCAKWIQTLQAATANCNSICNFGKGSPQEELEPPSGDWSKVSKPIQPHISGLSGFFQDPLLQTFASTTCP